MVCPTFTSNASACRTMEINAVGDFLLDILVALAPLLLDLSFLFCLCRCLPTRNTSIASNILHNCFCAVELINLLPWRPVCDAHFAPKRTVSAFCETNSIEQRAFWIESSTRYMLTPTRMSVSLMSRRACSRSLWMNRRPQLLRTKASSMI